MIICPVCEGAMTYYEESEEYVESIVCNKCHKVFIADKEDNVRD